MKSIPFKCRFGHITIKEFKNDREKPSIIECRECNNPSNIRTFIFANGKSYPSKATHYNFKISDMEPKTEMAVRF